MNTITITVKTADDGLQATHEFHIDKEATFEQLLTLNMRVLTAAQKIVSKWHIDHDVIGEEVVR